MRTEYGKNLGRVFGKNSNGAVPRETTPRAGLLGRSKMAARATEVSTVNRVPALETKEDGDEGSG
jgi:hypothetical protein